MIVWLTWAAMTVALAAWYLPDRSPVPLAEDWYTVPALTGHEEAFASWLWSQNNEHRVPLPRLIMLGILELAEGDFRGIGWFNLLLQSATAAGLIVFLRRRRGRADVADAFVPLTLLHWGHSVIYLFPFLLSLILPVVAVLAVGCVLASAGSATTPGRALVAGASLVAMPLCGFTGLLYVPVLGGYLGYAAWACWSGRRGWPRARRASGILALLVGLAWAVSGLYFIGYYRPWWNPPAPDLLTCLATALKVLAMAFGVAPQDRWAPFIVLILFLLAATAWCVLRGAPRRPGFERERAVGFILFLANAVAFAFVVGWGRANWVSSFGIPSRYALLAAPALVACFLAWDQFGAPELRRWVPRALALVMLVLVPWNTRGGDRWFADWYREGMTALHRDLDEGVPLPELARRHQPFLIHMWTPEQLELHMRWLGEEGIAPFDRAVATAPATP